MHFGLTITFPAANEKAHWHLYRKGSDGAVVSSCAMGYGEDVVDAARAAERYYQEHVVSDVHGK